MTPSPDAELERVLVELESDQPETRRTAISVAIQLGERAVSAIPVLQRMAAEDPVPDVRHHARKSLYVLALEAHMKGQGGPAAQPKAAVGPKSAHITEALSKEALPVVAKKLNHADPNVRASALRATAIKQDRNLLTVLLDRVGPTAEPDAELRAMLVRVIAILGGKTQLKVLAGYLDDPEPEVRATTVDVLAQLRDAMAFPFIMRALQDRDPKPQQRAGAALSKIGAGNILKICELMLSSDRAWSRDAAVFCLALTRVPDAAPHLEKALSDTEESVRKKARLGLERLAAQDVAAAREALARAGGGPPGAADTQELKRIAPVELPRQDLASPEPGARRVASKQLVALDGELDASLLPQLLDRMKLETDITVMLNLVTAIGRVQDAQVAPALADIAAIHAEEIVRASAVDALGKLRTEEALAGLRARLNDPSPVVMGRTLIALKGQPDVDLVAALGRMATRTEMAFRTTAVYVTAELGDPRLVPVLEKLAGDAEPMVASMAKDALGLLAPDVPSIAPGPSQTSGVTPGSSGPTTGSLALPPTRPGTRPGATNPKAGPVTRPGTGPIAVAPPVSPRVPGGGGLKAAAALMATGGLAWLVVAAWHLSADSVTGLQIGLGVVSLAAGLAGLFVGYACLQPEPWTVPAGLAVSALHALLALAQAALGLPPLAVLAPVGLASAALLLKARA